MPAVAWQLNSVHNTVSEAVLQIGTAAISAVGASAAVSLITSVLKNWLQRATGQQQSAWTKYDQVGSLISPSLSGAYSGPFSKRVVSVGLYLHSGYGRSDEDEVTTMN
eukprot:6211050-Pleurochrysis_carterae.AAC.6